MGAPARGAPTRLRRGARRRPRLELRGTLREELLGAERAAGRPEAALDHDLGAVLEQVRGLEAREDDLERPPRRAAGVGRLVHDAEAHLPAGDVALDRAGSDVAVDARVAPGEVGGARLELREVLEVGEGRAALEVRDGVPADE